MTSLLVISLAFLSGFFLSEYNFFVTLSDEKAVLQSNRQLKRDNETLLKDKFQLQSDLKIERKTYQLLKQQLSKLTESTTKLKTDLNFYRGIVNDSSKNSGLFLQKISIVPYHINAKDRLELLSNTLDLQEYTILKLSLSVIKKLKTHAYRRGNIEVILFDKLGEQISQWKLLDVNTKEVKKIPVRLRSFQTIDGYILVNKHHIPAKIKISFVDFLKGDIGVFEEVNWPFDLTEANTVETN